MEYFKRTGDQHFMKNGRGAEITVVLVQQARAKMSENKVNRPEDAVLCEMIKQLAQEKIYVIAKMLQGTHGDGGTKFLEDCEAGSSAETRRRTKKGVRIYRAIVLTSVFVWKKKRMRRLEAIPRVRH